MHLLMVVSGEWLENIKLTLESLNRAASEDLTADKMATLAFNLKPGIHTPPYAVFLYKLQFY